MNKRKRLFAAILTLLTTIMNILPAFAAGRVAEERITISGSSATVLQWFDEIERQTGIVLSYDPSAIDLGRRCTLSSGRTTVGGMLQTLLKGREVRLQEMPSRKLVIYVGEELKYVLSGRVADEAAAEKLYGATVSVDDGEGTRLYAQTDENGFFRFVLPVGEYMVGISYLGYSSHAAKVKLEGNRWLSVAMKPLPFEMEEITANSRTPVDEMGDLSPSSQLSFSSNDLFSQLWILPGVTGVPAGNNFQVDGGSYDENQLLVDGAPVYHPGHVSTIFPTINGDAVKSVAFHKGFFPTRLEGRLSSVTEMTMKSGNKRDFAHTLSLDMPAVSAVLEGPIVKDKLSYIVSGRRSWLDLFDGLLSEENRLGLSAYDYTAKLSYDVSPATTIEAFAYGAWDNYRLPLEEGSREPVLRWDNQLYQLRLNTRFGQVGNTTSLFYTSHTNRADAALFGYDGGGYLSSGVRTLNVLSEFSLALDNMFSIRWGAKYSHEIFDIASLDDDQLKSRRERINQYTVFYDNHIRIRDNLYAQVGVHFVGYRPVRHRDYYGIQPRLSLRYSLTSRDLLFASFSEMQQFYHFLRLETIALPTDFRMPSIDGFKPRASEHIELGWKHFLPGGSIEASVYYKTRRNVIALKPDTYWIEGSLSGYIMAGNGDSYGLKLFFFNNWPRWMLQAAYTFSRSREWFDEVKELGKLPSLYDVPHQFNVAVSYKLTSRSMLSLGGTLHSGRVTDDSDSFEFVPLEQFRRNRESVSYRVDAGYTFKKDFGRSLLAFRCGLYNIIGNPTEEEVLSFYTIYFNNHLLPYVGISFKF